MSDEVVVEKVVKVSKKRLKLKKGITFCLPIEVIEKLRQLKSQGVNVNSYVVTLLSADWSKEK